MKRVNKLSKEEVSSLYEIYKSTKNAGQACGVSEYTFRSWLREYGIPIQQRWNNNTQAITDAYLRLGTAKAVSDELGIGISAVKNHLKTHAGLSIKRGQFNILIAKQLYENGLSLDQIASSMGVSRPTITQGMKRAGIPIKRATGKPLTPSNLMMDLL